MIRTTQGRLPLVVALAVTLASPPGCCWIHQRTCSQECGEGWGLGPPSDTCALASNEGCIQVCPSAVANQIGVSADSVSNCAEPGNPGRKAPERELTLYETVQIAITNSEVVRNLGLVDARSNVDLLKGETTVYDRGIQRAEADAEWGIFDPLFTTEVFWERDNLPPGVSFNGFATRPPLLDTAAFVSGVSQRTLTGGTVSAFLDVDYLFNPDPAVTVDPNPQYFSRLDFGWEQPLLRGAGVDVNLSGIRIAAAEADQEIWDFKRELLAKVRSVESSAWKLHAAEYNLRAVEEVIPLFEEVVKNKQALVDRGVGSEGDVARAKSDLLLFKQERFEVLSTIAEQQIVLRNLMGLDPCDGQYLRLRLEPEVILPAEQPQTSLQVALVERPDVLRQKLAIYIAGQERIQARDSLRPELNGRALWRLNGLGDDVGTSIDVLSDGRDETWQLGAVLNVPLGRREGRGNVRAAELNLLRQRALLTQISHQAASEIADAHRRLRWLSEQYEVAGERVQALRDSRDAAKAKVDNPPPGFSYDLAFEIYTRNLNSFVEASRAANNVIADYNSAMARLEEVKGTLLDRRMIFVDGDPTDDVLEVVEPALEEPIPPGPPQAGSPNSALEPPSPSNNDPAALRMLPVVQAEPPIDPAAPVDLWKLPQDLEALAEPDSLVSFAEQGWAPEFGVQSSPWSAPSVAPAPPGPAPGATPNRSLATPPLTVDEPIATAPVQQPPAAAVPALRMPPVFPANPPTQPMAAAPVPAAPVASPTPSLATPQLTTSEPVAAAPVQQPTAEAVPALQMPPVNRVSPPTQSLGSAPVPATPTPAAAPTPALATPPLVVNKPAAPAPVPQALPAMAPALQMPRVSGAPTVGPRYAAAAPPLPVPAAPLGYPRETQAERYEAVSLLQPPIVGEAEPVRPAATRSPRIATRQRATRLDRATSGDSRPRATGLQMPGSMQPLY